MIPVETMELWNQYLAAEHVRVRQESLVDLERFTCALLKLSPEVWHSWARELARRVVDEQEEIPIRLPLFRLVIFPALFAGLKKSIPGSARWLAGFAHLFYHSRSCCEELPENERSEYGLLLRAIQDDPTDMRAKRRLLIVMRGRFDYALHELPSAVLYDGCGASIEQCDKLMKELAEYVRLAEEVGCEDEDRELIAEAKFHIPAYKHYLSGHGPYTSYEHYLSTRPLT